MECNEITVRDWDGIREYLCGNVSLARLISINDEVSVLSIDVLSPWDIPIDETLKIGDVKLMYRREVINNLKWEFVGYDDGVRRELISIRIFVGKGFDDSAIKELIINAVKTYSRYR